jgi:hypothetical protein
MSDQTASRVVASTEQYKMHSRLELRAACTLIGPTIFTTTI